MVQSTSNALQQLREQVALANRLLHHYGLAAYQGQVSARIPGTDRMLIKAAPDVSMDRVQPEDLMVLDLDGNIIEASQDYSDRTDEWPLHAEVYRARPEVAAVTHTHQRWVTILGVAGRPVLPLLHHPTAAIAAEEWPVYEETRGPITGVTQARLVAKALGGNVACHLRCHGVVFVGTTVSRSVLAAADGELMAELTWRALAAGTPETIPMMYMRDDVDQRFQPPREEVRDGVARGEWDNQEWLDNHRDAAWVRGITL